MSGDAICVAVTASVVVLAKDVGRLLQQSLLRSLDLAGVDLVSFIGRTSWATVSSAFTASRAALALNNVLPRKDASSALLTCPATPSQQRLSVILGAEPSLNHLPEIPGAIQEA